MTEADRFSPRRELGRTGFAATALGIGDLADRSVPLETCVATARRALDAGLNVIDTAPNYEDGYSEQVVGRAVRERLRDTVFVIDKIDHHGDPVGSQIDDSLRRLELDHADAFVFHGLSSAEAFDRLCLPGSGFDQLADAVRAGKCRFRGISSHDPDVLRAALTAGVCDLAMFPVGPFVDPRYVADVLPLAKSLGIGTVCFKTFGAGKLLGDTAGYNQPLKARPRGKVSSGGSDDNETTLPRLTVARKAQRAARRPRQRKPGAGRKATLAFADRLLIARLYYRGYVAQEFVGFVFGVDKGMVSRTVQELGRCTAGVFRIPERTVRVAPDDLAAVFVDATEQPVHRPQRRSYSGKKKRHTVKHQVVVTRKRRGRGETQKVRIKAVSKAARGRVHDQTVYDRSRQRVPPRIPKSGDSGYQGATSRCPRRSRGTGT